MHFEQSTVAFKWCKRYDNSLGFRADNTILFRIEQLTIIILQPLISKTLTKSLNTKNLRSLEILKMVIAKAVLQGPPYILAREERLFFTNVLLV